MVASDTLKLARRLREGAGFTPEHADAMTEQVASKSDLRETEFRLTAVIEKTRTELDSKISNIDSRIEASAANAKAEILKWMFGAMAAQTALIAGLIKLTR